MKRDLLLEIGCENLPSGYIDGAIDQLEKILSGGLRSLNIECDVLYVTGTPNRLVAHARGLPARQKAAVTTVTGPPVSIAVADDGSYTKAAEGFAKRQGIPVGKLVRVETDRGEYICARIEEKGQGVAGILREMLPGWIMSLRFPKVMRWDSSDLRFARPIRWILAFLGERPLKLKLGSIASSPQTRLSPFFEEMTAVESIDHYFTVIKGARKILDRDARERAVRTRARKAAEAAGGILVEDDQLCSMVANLIESPVGMTGSFDGKFLELPREVVVTALKSHQRYFSVQDGEGRLMPFFVAFADGARRNKAQILKGYERVLQARLEDARFYYREDTSVSIEEMSRRLGGIVWLEGLGTLAAKAERMESIALGLCESWKPGDEGLASRAARASKLAKADLASEMVKDGKEFTLLQGYIGREYASVSGEEAEVAEAIYEHHLPRFAGDSLPSTDTGTVLALADRLDTIAGCFIQGLGPTGSQDPYALRRHAVGILRIAMEKEIPLSIPEAVRMSAGQFDQAARPPSGEGDDQLIAGMIDLFSQRLITMLRGEGFDYDLVSAALSAPWEYPSVVRSIVSRLQRMRNSGDLARFVLAMKRIVNILPREHRGPVDRGEGLRALRELSGSLQRTFDESIMEEESERALLDEASEAASNLIELGSGDRGESVEILAGLVPAVNSYFDGVLVNCEDSLLRGNRTAFLLTLKRGTGRFCSFSEIIADQNSQESS